MKIIFTDLDWFEISMGFGFSLRRLPAKAKRLMMHKIPAAYEVIAVKRR